MVSREIGKRSVNRALRALRAMDEHSIPLVKAFCGFQEIPQWDTLDEWGVDILADIKPHCAEMLGITGKLPIQIKSSKEGIEDFIAQKKEVDRIFRYRDKHRLRVLVLNGLLPPDEFRIQCALGIVNYVGLLRDPRDYEVKDLLTTFFHPRVVRSTLERMRNNTDQSYAGTVVEFPVKYNARI